MKLPALKAWFMVFRILAVIVWAVTTVTMSTAIAYSETGKVDWINFILVLLVASIVQGFPAHIVNEIIDWESGADQFKKLGEKSGGSKVIKAGLATVPQLWMMFFVTSLAGFALMGVLFLRSDPRILLFFVPGYFVCIFYTLPPVQLAYRPFAGEWLGGFTGIVLNMTGCYFAQTGKVSATIVVFSICVGLCYVAIMILFHYLDYDSDKQARPLKNTTIVFLGLKRSKVYAAGLLMFSILISVIMAFRLHPLFYWLALNNAIQLIFQWRCDPFSEESIVRIGKWITFEMIGFGILFSSLNNIKFFWVSLLVLLSFYLHRKFGRLRLAGKSNP
jgi:1,4-dihydroxy-2-naphthoate octaprenyltransferase